MSLRQGYGTKWEQFKILCKLLRIIQSALTPDGLSKIFT